MGHAPFPYSIPRHDKMTALKPLAVGAVMLVLATAFLPQVSDKMTDFEVYWRAGARAMAAEPLYRPEDGHYQNKYLPALALIVVPLSFLPLETAKVVWFYIS